MPTEISTSEYIQRRQKVLTALKDSMGVVYAGEGAPPLLGRWHPDFNFHYLTGLSHEAGAAVLFNPTSPDPTRRCVLFLRPLNPELERWDGYRDPISSALKSRTGFDAVMRSITLSATL